MQYIEINHSIKNIVINVIEKNEGMKNIYLIVT